MGKTKARWIVKDDQSLESGPSQELQVKLDPDGVLTKSVAGLNLISGITNGNVLTWDNSLGRWQSKSPQEVNQETLDPNGYLTRSVAGLGLVAGTTNGNVLTWNGSLSQWQSAPAIPGPKGDTGSIGPQGIPGVTGPQGVAGTNGTTPIIAAQLAGTTVVTNVTTLNITGGATVTDSGNGKATINVTSQATFKYWIQDTSPPTPYTGGDMWFKSNNLYVYDSSRSKWLSPNRNLYCFTSNNNVKNAYLPPFGNTNAAASIFVGRDGTLCSISGNSDGTATVTMQLYAGTTLLYSWDWVNGGNHEWQPINVDIAAGLDIRLYASGTNTLICPLITMKVAWRVS